MRRLLLALVPLTVVAVTACGYSDPYPSSGGPVANESPNASAAVSPSPGTDDFNAGAGLPVVTFPDGLKYIDLKVGTGDVAKSGENITVEYTGWLTDGTIFDSSRPAGRKPFKVQIGVGNVIAGWDEGIPGMRVGGKRKLLIPSALAYGAQGQTDQSTGAVIIPPNADLVFEVELLSVAQGPSPSPSPKPSPSPTPSPSSTASPSPKASPTK